MGKSENSGFSETIAASYLKVSRSNRLSKLLEKHVHDSLMGYLSSNSLLHSTQSGFRPNHSCETSLLQMINK